MHTNDTIFLLEGKVQHYAWGGYEFIPAMIQKENPMRIPFAEYWLGAHPGNAAEVVIDKFLKVPLNDFIEQDAESRLGKNIIESYKQLPFLFKLLDVRDMLSIQVHPDKKNAVIEFEREQEAGIPIQANHRNYKDNNHKLELAVAIDEHWLLHGFKPAEKLMETLSSVPEFNSFIHIFNISGYQGLYSYVMELAQASVNAILQTLVNRVCGLYESGSLNKNQEDYWAAKAALAYTQDGNIDRGIFSIYFLNLFKLNRGEGIYQDAGILHAYLEGNIIELMSNSDNVLRGGLTVKHIDIDELMRLVNFSATVPEILNPVKMNHATSFYDTEAPDFLLKKYSLQNGQLIPVKTEAIEILFVLEGEINIQQGNKVLHLVKGQSALLLANQTIQLKAISNSVIFGSTVKTP